MAQGEGLTNRQKEFLAVVLQTPYILKKFYLSGGTALSSWYLHHRESFDLDFFSEEEVNSSYIMKWLSSLKKKLGIQDIVHEEQFGFNFFILTYTNGYHFDLDTRNREDFRIKTLELTPTREIAVVTRNRGRARFTFRLDIQEKPLYTPGNSEPEAVKVIVASQTDDRSRTVKVLEGPLVQDLEGLTSV